MQRKMHFKEDTTKPENRINITLFHLFMIDEVFNFIKEKLRLKDNIFIYPCPKLEVEEFGYNDRPDFQIIDENDIIGYIEVELGKENKEQLQRYRTKQGKPVYSIVGKASYNEGNIALDEILQLLNKLKNTYMKTQKAWSIKLFEHLIDYYIVQGNYNNDNKRNGLSDKIKNSKLIVDIYKSFGQENILENAQIQRGKIMFDTVSEYGFSLRVYSHVVSKKARGFSLMSRTAGQDYVDFPSYAKLEKYLPHCEELIERYVNLIYELGGSEIRIVSERKKIPIELNKVEENVEKFCNIIKSIIK